MLCCATCGFSMQTHGLMTGGAIVVTCTGFECPEYNVQRKYQAAVVDLLEIEAGDLVPIDVQPEKPEAPVVEIPAPVVSADPPDTLPSEAPV